MAKAIEALKNRDQANEEAQIMANRMTDEEQVEYRRLLSMKEMVLFFKVKSVWRKCEFDEHGMVDCEDPAYHALAIALRNWNLVYQMLELEDGMGLPFPDKNEFEDAASIFKKEAASRRWTDEGV